MDSNFAFLTRKSKTIFEIFKHCGHHLIGKCRECLLKIDMRELLRSQRSSILLTIMPQA